MQTFGGSAEVKFFSDRDETAELAQVHRKLLEQLQALPVVAALGVHPGGRAGLKADDAIRIVCEYDLFG